MIRLVDRLPLILLLAMVFVAPATQAAAPAFMTDEARADPDRHIVVTIANPTSSRRSGSVGGTVRGYQGGGAYRASPAAIAVVRELSREYELSTVSEWPIEELQVHCIVFRIAPGASRDDVLKRLQQDENVIIAQPLNEFAAAAATYDDPYAKLQRNVQAMHVQDAHRFSRGHGIRVAVIDTGIDVEHPDLGGRVDIGGNYVDEDAAAWRTDRHGTQVAGLIAATANNGIGIVGVAPEVKLLAFKACWHDRQTDEGRCNSFTLAQALAGAIAARSHVINLSLVGPSDPLLTALVKKALAARIIVVGAVGSEAEPGAFPAGIAGVLAVAESEAEMNAPNLLRAPGRDVVTLTPQGHYDFASGSSLATAQVSGVVALLLERDRDLEQGEVFKILRASMERASLSHDAVTSVNACVALSMLRPSARCAASGSE